MRVRVAQFGLLLASLSWFGGQSIGSWEVDAGTAGQLLLLGAAGPIAVRKSLSSYWGLLVFAAVGLIAPLVAGLFQLTIPLAPIVANGVFALAVAGFLVLLPPSTADEKKRGIGDHMVFVAIAALAIDVGPGNMPATFVDIATLDSGGLTELARRHIADTNFVPGFGFVDVNSHNRVAQSFFALGFASHCLRGEGESAVARLALLFRCCFIVASVVLGSGQVLLALMVWTVVWIATSSSTRGRLLGALTVTTAGFAIAQIDEWRERFSSTDLTTGRTARFERGLSGVADGLAAKSLTEDPHSLLLTWWQSFGVMGLIAWGLFVLATGHFALRIFALPQCEKRSNSLAALGMFFVSTAISGGFGMPGWSEFFKLGIPLLVLAEFHRSSSRTGFEPLHHQQKEDEADETLQSQETSPSVATSFPRQLRPPGGAQRS